MWGWVWEDPPPRRFGAPPNPFMIVRVAEDDQSRGKLVHTPERPGGFPKVQHGATITAEIYQPAFNRTPDLSQRPYALPVASGKRLRVCGNPTVSPFASDFTNKSAVFSHQKQGPAIANWVTATPFLLNRFKTQAIAQVDSLTGRDQVKPAAIGAAPRRQNR